MKEISHLARFQFRAFRVSFYNLKQQMSKILLGFQQ